MHYSKGAMWRPLFEDTDAFLQVATGCSHNACKFCTMHKGTTFSLSPEDEVAADIQELAAATWVRKKRVFLTGGNSLCIPQERLVKTLKLLHDQIPQVQSVGTFARVADVRRKSDDDLRQLAALGVSDISIGAETGYDPALAFMRKGHTAADIVEQCARLDRAGITYNLFYLAGIAGEGNGEKNARATAQVFGQTHPNRIMIHTLTLFDGADLHDDIAAGDFTPSSEVGILQELRVLVQELPISTFLLGGHIGNVAPFNACLPEHREEVLRYLDHAIAGANEAELEEFRKSMKSL